MVFSLLPLWTTRYLGIFTIHIVYLPCVTFLHLKILLKWKKFPPLHFNIKAALYLKLCIEADRWWEINMYWKFCTHLCPNLCWLFLLRLLEEGRTTFSLDCDCYLWCWGVLPPWPHVFCHGWWPAQCTRWLNSITMWLVIKIPCHCRNSSWKYE